MSAPPNEQEQEETLTFPSSHAALIDPYLPTLSPEKEDEERREKMNDKVYLTLTYAHSLDAALSLSPGVRTILSGRLSKAMTHYLRARHDAILVGVGTAVADDPGLNSRVRLTDCSTRQPRPVVLDPRGRWAFGAESKVVRLAAEGKGMGPWVLVGEGAVIDEGRRKILEKVGGGFLFVPVGAKGRFEWEDVLRVLSREGVRSVMVEGGGEVINSLLATDKNGLVDSVIVTIAPTWLGQGGVVVSPPRVEGPNGEPPQQVRLADVRWCPMEDDVVLCGRIAR